MYQNERKRIGSFNKSTRRTQFTTNYFPAFFLKRTMIIQCLSMALLFSTFALTEKAGKWMYVIWVCLIFGTFCGNFALFPTATAKAFGQKYFTVNYGMIFSSQVRESTCIYNHMIFYNRNGF